MKHRVKFGIIVYLIAALFIIYISGCMENKEAAPVVIESSPAHAESSPAPGAPAMVLIEGGTFEMGSERHSSMQPVHKVEISSFYMGKYEVTNKEFNKFKPEHDYSRWKDDDFPVQNVTWYDAVKYCNWLSEQEGFPRCYSGSKFDIKLDMSKTGYRLPTEAEWEYACRAGTTTEYYWGDKINGDFCWYRDNSEKKLHPVGQKIPNPWGLYDMSGSVWEWCWGWNSQDYSNSSGNNPTGPSTGIYRTLRGGSWDFYAEACSSASRSFVDEADTGHYFGFRIVRGAPGYSQ